MDQDKEAPNKPARFGRLTLSPNPDGTITAAISSTNRDWYATYCMPAEMAQKLINWALTQQPKERTNT